MGRAIILVADGFGIGSAPDAEAFGDTGANTFAHVAQYFEQRTVNRWHCQTLPALV